MPDFGDIDPNTGRPSSRTEFEGTVDPFAPSVANGQITPAQWAEYQSKRRRAAILGSLGLLGGTIGGGFLSQALTGGAGAAGAAASGSGAGTGALAPVAGGAPWAVTPFAGTATMAGTGAGAGAGIAGGAGSVLAGLSARDIAALGASLAGTVGGAMSKPPDTNPTTATSDPNIQALMQMMQRRLDKSEPLYDSVLAMADGLLPTRYQKGGGGMG